MKRYNVTGFGERLYQYIVPRGLPLIWEKKKKKKRSKIYMEQNAICKIHPKP